MPVAVALLAVKALVGSAGPPRDLIVHGAAFLASFAACVALALALLMLKDNVKCAYQIQAEEKQPRSRTHARIYANTGDLYSRWMEFSKEKETRVSACSRA